MEYDVLAFIGRFQPFHFGHKAVIEAAFTKAKKVAVILGSDEQARSSRNPFSTQERIDMISRVFPREVADGRLFFCPQVDHTYNMDRWIAGVQASVRAVANTPFTPDPQKIGLIGHSKDASSFYLKSFPMWDSIEVPNWDGINATDMRNEFFRSGVSEKIVDNVPFVVCEWLKNWQETDSFEQVQQEWRFVSNYKKQWEAAPYAPTFFTADAVVTQSGHILLVKRGAMPGKGLWALPGGFIDAEETSRDAAIRELREETKIAVPEPVLRGSIHSWRMFEDPHRSQRGRTITVAYRIELRAAEKLPKIKGSDDAAVAQWVPISNLRRRTMYEDHYDIIEEMVNI